MNNISNQDLSEKIERLVREHIESARCAAMAAIERAFASSVSASPATTSKGTRAKRRRRDPKEVVALSEQLYIAVCAHPGESMAVITIEVGRSARELHRPMQMLKRAGRVHGHQEPSEFEVHPRW